jgi:hypothetical protein
VASAATRIAFQNQVKERFGVHVSLISSSSVFRLVASFSLSAICIDVDYVSLILQSCLGGVSKIKIKEGPKESHVPSSYLVSRVL